jgi:metal-dependent HD superfamily phosphatase/phosphodiesterase
MDKQATFSEMKNGTAEDYAIIAEEGSKHASELPNRIMDHLNLLKGDNGGFAVDRFTHSIQTASRAHRDGKDEEYVVCALLHDIGDSISSGSLFGNIVALAIPINFSILVMIIRK